MEDIEIKEIEATSGPAEIYTAVQTLGITKRCCEVPGSGGIWEIGTEDGEIYNVKEFYCNVPTSSAYNEALPADILAVGRLTISNGVAYVDVG